MKGWRFRSQNAYLPRASVAFAAKSAYREVPADYRPRHTSRLDSSFHDHRFDVQRNMADVDS